MTSSSRSTQRAQPPAPDPQARGPQCSPCRRAGCSRARRAYLRRAQPASAGFVGTSYDGDGGWPCGAPLYLSLVLACSKDPPTMWMAAAATEAAIQNSPPGKHTSTSSREREISDMPTIVVYGPAQRHQHHLFTRHRSNNASFATAAVGDDGAGSRETASALRTHL